MKSNTRLLRTVGMDGQSKIRIEVNFMKHSKWIYIFAFVCVSGQTCLTGIVWFASSQPHKDWSTHSTLPSIS